MGQLHNTGEEWMLKRSFDDLSASTVSIGLYNTSNSLFDDSDVVDINTEPSGSGYSRQSVSIGSDFTFSKVGGNWQTVISNVVFDTDASTENVDGYFVTVTFESEEAGDSSPQEHLVFTGSLDNTYDLGSVTQFTLQNSGISLD